MENESDKARLKNFWLFQLSESAMRAWRHADTTAANMVESDLMLSVRAAGCPCYFPVPSRRPKLGRQASVSDLPTISAGLQNDHAIGLQVVSMCVLPCCAADLLPFDRSRRPLTSLLALGSTIATNSNHCSGAPRPILHLTLRAQDRCASNAAPERTGPPHSSG